MGTYADFYIGTKPETMEYLGSLFWDGYPDNDEIKALFKQCTTKKTYRNEVIKFIGEQEGALADSGGWPFPWNSSETSDWAYTWTKDGIKCSAENRWTDYWAWIAHEEKVAELWKSSPHEDEPPFPFTNEPDCDFPDMTAKRKQVRMDGLIIVAAGGVVDMETKAALPLDAQGSIACPVCGTCGDSTDPGTHAPTCQVGQIVRKALESIKKSG